MSANSGAIGLPVDDLETPALCLDLDAYHRNVARMVEVIIRRHGLAWRPHMKGQKVPELARHAIRAGAIGVTCATVYEAEAMAEAGATGILIANQVVGKRKLDRLARLAGRASVMAATDSAAHAAMLAAAAARSGVTIPVLIEVNVGMNRCGAAPGAPTVELARAVASTQGLQLEGLMGWEGHTVPLEGDAKAAGVAQAMSLLVESAQACRAAGIAIGIVSSSGSATFPWSVPVAGLTEVQAGGGVFSDLNYRKWGLADHEFALTVLTRVVSRPDPRRIIVDGGFKTMSVQHGLPQPLGLGEVSSLTLSAEHGTIELAAPDTAHRVGDIIRFVPGYTDSTVCLHDEMCATRGGRLEAVWAIPGRTGRR